MRQSGVSEETVHVLNIWGSRDEIIVLKFRSGESIMLAKKESQFILKNILTSTSSNITKSLDYRKQTILRVFLEHAMDVVIEKLFSGFIRPKKKFNCQIHKQFWLPWCLIKRSFSWMRFCTKDCSDWLWKAEVSCFWIVWTEQGWNIWRGSGGRNGWAILLFLSFGSILSGKRHDWFRLMLTFPYYIVPTWQ